MQELIEELTEAAEAFEVAEFHDDMPIDEAPDLLRRAAAAIAALMRTP